MRCITVINYRLKSHPEYGPQPCFVTDYLTDRAFAVGFRILNPEYNASPDRISYDTEALNSLIEELDSSDISDYHPYNRNWVTPKHRNPDRRSK